MDVLYTHAQVEGGAVIIYVSLETNKTAYIFVARYGDGSILLYILLPYSNSSARKENSRRAQKG
jgi:hypothetical protein